MADRTLKDWDATNGVSKTTTFPQPARTSDASGARPKLLFDAATDEATYFEGIVPQGIVSPFKMVASIAMESATSGNVIIDGTLEAITSGDSTDTDAAESLDTANVSSATAVPGTAGFMLQISVTLTNNDSLTAGDMFRLRFRRVGSNGSDTATGDLALFKVELRDDGL